MENKLYHFTHDVNTIVKDEKGFSNLKYVRTDEFFFIPTKPSILTIERNGVKKNIRIVDDSEYTYSVKKTQVNANGGAEGLAKFLADEEWRTVAVKLLNAMMDNVKEAKFLPFE